MYLTWEVVLSVIESSYSFEIKSPDVESYRCSTCRLQEGGRQLEDMSKKCPRPFDPFGCESLRMGQGPVDVLDNAMSCPSLTIRSRSNMYRAETNSQKRDFSALRSSSKDHCLHCEHRRRQANKEERGL